MADNFIISDNTSERTALKTRGRNGVETICTDVDNMPLQNVDAFSRLRVSNPGYRFDAQLTYQIDSDLWDTKTTNGTVAHSATERWAALTANASGINSAVLQSHYHAPYTPGRGQLAFVTFVMGAAPATGGYKRAGYFDGTNGIYLERTASAVNLVLKSSTSKGTETVPQASWNIDPMTGSGPSGLTLDLTDCQILAIQMQALYVGRVVVGFDVNGDLIPVHEFQCANEEPVPYIAQASLPVRYEVGGTADTGTPTVMHAVCASVISEGGDNLENVAGRQFAASGTLTDADPKIAVMVIRPKAQLNSVNQNAVVIPTEISASALAAGCWIEVRRNATISAGTFTDVDAASVVECSFAGNAGTDPAADGATGTLIDKFYLPASASARASDTAGLIGKAVLSYSHLLGAADSLTIFAEGGATTQVFASLKWKEIR